MYAILMFIVTFVGKCKSREANKVVNAFHFQFLLSETGRYLWHLYCACMLVFSFFFFFCFFLNFFFIFIHFILSFFLNFTAKDGFIGNLSIEFINCLTYIFSK